MSYELIFSNEAEEDLGRLPPHLLNIVEEHLDRLAEHPAAVSRPSVSPPYPPGFMMYSFRHDEADGTEHRFTVLFRYMADEAHLWVGAVGHIEPRTL
jgi:hypothetical protein